MEWTLQDRGFLPNIDPVVDLRPYGREFTYLEQLSLDLKYLVDDKKFQEQITNNIPVEKSSAISELFECGNDMAVERAFMIFSYLASAQIHAKDYRGLKHKQIPAIIAQPLVRLARYLGRPPILSYTSYCLHNWKRIDPNGPIALGNIALLQNFTQEAKSDEDWFILVHVDIEAKAHDALAAMSKLRWCYNVEEAIPEMKKMVASLTAMNDTLQRMPEACSPEIYYDKVRPYIFGFENVVYRGCFDEKPQNFRGETGAQSSIIPAVINFLGIRHKDSMLTKHLRDMRNYMPKEHVKFIDDMPCEFPSRVKNFATQTGGESAIDLYNACIEQVILFRKTHLEYAVNYIQKRVDNPTGTGGTPYVQWLGNLTEETKAFLIK